MTIIDVYRCTYDVVCTMDQRKLFYNRSRDLDHGVHNQCNSTSLASDRIGGLAGHETALPIRDQLEI